MQNDPLPSSFRVLSSNNLIYGPIDLAILVQWVRERRLERDPWELLEPANEWVGAGTLEFLLPEFDSLKAEAEAEPRDVADATEVAIAELREFDRFNPYSNEELEILLRFCEHLEAQPGELIIRKGDLSDAMFLVLSGRVQACITVGGHKTDLGAMEPGEIFGEVAMLSRTARTADVVAEVPTRLLRLTSDGFHELMAEHSALAAKILFNLSHQLASRLAHRNAELQRDLASNFVWR